MFQDTPLNTDAVHKGERIRRKDVKMRGHHADKSFQNLSREKWIKNLKVIVEKFDGGENR